MRPEAKALLWRWREVIVAVVVTALFASWALSSFGWVAWFAWAVTALSVIFAFAAIQRARFATDGGGFGSVEVDEGVISFFSPLTGGQVAIADLLSVTLVPAGKGKAHWHLSAPAQPDVIIPVDAHGSDKLFDVFVNLPGIETEKMLRQIKQAPEHAVVVWRKSTVALH